jgi:hypothetical protein
MWHAWENMYKVLVGKPEGKRPLGISRRRWEDVIKMDLKGDWLGGGGGGVWIHLAQDRDLWWGVVNSVINFWVLVPLS